MVTWNSWDCTEAMITPPVVLLSPPRLDILGFGEFKGKLRKGVREEEVQVE